MRRGRNTRDLVLSVHTQEKPREDAVKRWLSASLEESSHKELNWPALLSWTFFFLSFPQHFVTPLSSLFWSPSFMLEAFLTFLLISGCLLIFKSGLQSEMEFSLWICVREKACQQVELLQTHLIIGVPWLE